MNCICEFSSMILGSEFLNLQQGAGVSIASPGDPLGYPIDYRTYLEVALPDTAGSNNIIVKSTDNLVGKYIRIDNEILFVKSHVKGAGVKNVGTFKASKASCSCSFDGVPSPVDGGCSCTGEVLQGCTRGGTLDAAGGGGSGFAAAFTVSGGRIASIVVTSPGSYVSQPEIFVNSGGEGCVNLHNYTSLYATMSQNVLVVTRAALGTTQEAHNAYSHVQTVLWPSQKDYNKPGKRYNFRIAAFNGAGLSNFIYYDIKLYEVFPRKMKCRGGELLEIILVGAGTIAANVHVYIGHTDENEELGKSRSRECTGLQILDKAGTKLTCRSPVWVGKQHDLIVHFQSGMFEHFAVGRSWMSYEPPTIDAVTPSNVNAGKPVNVTISGANFGNDESAVSGHLEGASVLECTPLILLGDAQAICMLVPKAVCDVFMPFPYSLHCVHIIWNGECLCMCMCARTRTRYGDYL